MSKIVHTPVLPHSCDPGWTWTPIPDDEREALQLVPGGKGGRYGKPPSSYDYPKGTVWECDCGNTWISTGPLYSNWPGSCGFRREGRFARRRGERRST